MKRPPNKATNAGCSLIFLLLLCGPIDAASILNAGLSYSYNDNLSNGELDSDIKGDQYWDLSASAGQYRQLNRDYGLIIKGSVGANAYSTYSGFNGHRLGAAATLRRKFGLGPKAPMVSASLDATYRNSNDDQRDRWVYKAGFGLSKRVSDRFKLSLDYHYLETDPDSRAEPISFLLDNFGIGGNVWKIQRSGISLSGTFGITQFLSAYGGYSWQEGTIVSSTIPDFTRISVYEEASFDPIFGEGVVAYAIEADSEIANLGLSLALNDRSSFNISIEYRDSEGGAGFVYTNTITQASLQYAF